MSNKKPTRDVSKVGAVPNTIPQSPPIQNCNDRHQPTVTLTSTGLCSNCNNQKAQRIAEYKQLHNELPTDEILTTKYGYHSDEKKYGFRIAISECRAIIQAKIKEME